MVSFIHRMKFEYSHRLTAALAALSLVCGWLALRPERSGAAVATTPRPLWSPDRFPALLAEAQGAVDLERAVDELLARSLAAPPVPQAGARFRVLLTMPDQRTLDATRSIVAE